VCFAHVRTWNLLTPFHRSRILLALVPLSPIMMCGIADAIVYRRMDGQGTMDSTGGIVSVVKQITSEVVTTFQNTGSGVVSTVTDGSVLNLFNYGLLTAVHAVPGFISFVAMR
jgi:hypothetical protein